MKIKRSFNPFKKIYNFLLRRALFKNRHKYSHMGLPIYVGLINDYISIDIMVDGAYDITSMEEIIQLLQSDFINFKCETLIDIGANIGNHSVFLSQYFKNVIAFEPNPFTFKILKLNASKYLNINVHNFGISSKRESLYLSEDVKNLGGSKIYTNKDDVPNGLTIRDISLEKLDDLDLNNCKNGILIKLDVEGHEFEALKGSKNFIQKNTPIICFEQHAEDFLNRSSPSIEFLTKLGYEFYLFNSKYDVYKFGFIKLFFRLFLGDNYQLTKIVHFKPSFYNSIISIHPDTIN